MLRPFDFWTDKLKQIGQSLTLWSQFILANSVTESIVLPRRHFALLCLSIFLLAFAVRTLTWQDNHNDAWKVQTSVTARYKESARQLVAGDLKGFVSDVQRLGHPPGYPILIATIYILAGESDSIVQFIQITFDSAAVLVLFLIALEMFRLPVAILTGVLAALSPQFAYFSVLLLPDSLVVLPILLSVYLIVRSRRHYRLSVFLISGVLVGLSCWLRANALLLPLFLAALAVLVVPRGKRLSAALTIVAGAILVIAPITIKNAVVFHRFIPLSLGTGQTLLEGIADYDEQNRFNIPRTDLGLQRQEADWFGKPSYADGLFNEDGIERDRMRIARGFQIIRSHPLWFMTVVFKRALASTRLDPVLRLLPESPVSHPLDTLKPPVWQNTPVELIRGERSQKADFRLVDDKWLRINSDDQAYGNQLASELIRVEPFNDYVLTLPLKLEQGRVSVSVTSGDGQIVLGSRVVDVTEGVDPNDQPTNQLTIPFVSAKNSQLRFAIANNASGHSTMLVGTAQLIQLGPSSFFWLRYIRVPLEALQRAFTTACVLPFVLIGVVVLICKRRWLELAILLAVPTYYLLVQSALHTERRYLYVIHFFFLILVSVAFCWIAGIVSRILIRRKISSGGS
jgi:4-amino-4-deoxy-L-arabinose transferase and related glycosyltransferases of PMT family